MIVTASASSMVADLITIIGVPAMAGGFVYVGKRLQVLRDLEETMKKVKGNLKAISDYLTRHHIEFNPAELTSFSPLRLTEQGNKLIAELNFSDIFKKNKKQFFDVIDGEEPKFKYDVENAAIKSIHLLSDEPYMNVLKIYFYNHPERNMSNVAPTLGIYLRDKYLEEHPEIRE